MFTIITIPLLVFYKINERSSKQYDNRYLCSLHSTHYQKGFRANLSHIRILPFLCFRNVRSIPVSVPGGQVLHRGGGDHPVHVHGGADADAPPQPAVRLLLYDRPRGGDRRTTHARYC